MTAIPKFEYLRSEKHLNAIRALPCCNCGADPRSQAAHINSSTFGKGTQKKASDEATIPLCVSCHQAYDQSTAERDDSFNWFMGHLKTTAHKLKKLNKLTKDASRLLYERGVL